MASSRSQKHVTRFDPEARWNFRVKSGGKRNRPPVINRRNGRSKAEKCFTAVNDDADVRNRRLFTHCPCYEVQNFHIFWAWKPKLFEGSPTSQHPTLRQKDFFTQDKEQEKYILSRGIWVERGRERDGNGIKTLVDKTGGAFAFQMTKDSFAPEKSRKIPVDEKRASIEIKFLA